VSNFMEIYDSGQFHPLNDLFHGIAAGPSTTDGDPEYQRHEHVERLLWKAAQLPERAGLQVWPVAHAWVRRSRM
jgi:hypothetical protein